MCKTKKIARYSRQIITKWYVHYMEASVLNKVCGVAGLS